jgi:hypothetical protein
MHAWVYLKILFVEHKIAKRGVFITFKSEIKFDVVVKGMQSPILFVAYGQVFNFVYTVIEACGSSISVSCLWYGTIHLFVNTIEICGCYFPNKFEFSRCTDTQKSE